MGKAIVVTSGKGGVGKTTTTAALGAALAQRGEKVVVVDFDVGLRNLDQFLQASRLGGHDLPACLGERVVATPGVVIARGPPARLLDETGVQEARDDPVQGARVEHDLSS